MPDPTPPPPADDAALPALLDKLEALAAAATLGPWETDRHGAHIHGRSPAERNRFGLDARVAIGLMMMARNEAWVPNPEREANAAFVAASREAVPALCAATRRLLAENARLRGELAQARGAAPTTEADHA